jgi:hypothetical protein
MVSTVMAVHIAPIRTISSASTIPKATARTILDPPAAPSRTAGKTVPKVSIRKRMIEITMTKGLRGK